MSITDPTAAELDAVFTTAPSDAAFQVNRRRFLQAVAAGATVASMPTWLGEMAAGAEPVAPTDGILVVITASGGLDGLHTVVPTSSGAYYDARGDLAIARADALAISSSRGLHPKLRRVHGQWNNGSMGVLDGVGNPSRDLSHFTTTADLMNGGPTSGAARTGWVGRYIDELSGHFTCASLGDRMPLLVRGTTDAAVALPLDHRLVPVRDDYRLELHRAFDAYGGSFNGRGALASAVAATTGDMMAESDVVRDLYTGDTDRGLASQMALAAGLINADLGLRVVSAVHHEYDSHVNQPAMYDARLGELDAAIGAFFDTLDPRFADQVMVLVQSEFGRRVAANGSLGTDHGAGNLVLAFGNRVRGGLHGQLPSLTDLTADGNLRHSISYREVLASVIDRWLGGDARAIVGVDGEDLGLFDPPGPEAESAPLPLPIPELPLGKELSGSEADVLRLYRAFFDREPDVRGANYWIDVHAKGDSLDDIAEWFTGSPEFAMRYASTSNREYLRRVYANVLGRAYDEKGFNYWLGMLDRRKLSRGGVVRWVSASPEFKSRYPYTHMPV